MKDKLEYKDEVMDITTSVNSIMELEVELKKKLGFKDNRKIILKTPATSGGFITISNDKQLDDATTIRLFTSGTLLSDISMNFAISI